MKGADQVRRFATLGNHLPRHCIATFTTHLTDALVEQLPGADGFVVAMNDGGRHHAYPLRVRFEIGEGDLFTRIAQLQAQLDMVLGALRRRARR